MPSSLWKNGVGGIVGNVMEWYDFAVFGYLTPILSHHFFPEEDKLTALIMTYGIFATGYLMRPLGGVLFGFVGDRYGRKKALLLSIFMMALPTVLIALLPTYAQIGWVAALLLILLRMIQGLSVGGELIGSVSFMVEIAPANRKGLFGSLTLGSAVGGLLLGSATVMTMQIFLGEACMRAWGWRLPFLGGLVILATGLWLRRQMGESPEFLKLEQTAKIDKTPLKEALRNGWRSMLRLTGIVALATVTSYIMFVWVPTFLSQIVDHPLHDTLRINTAAMVILLLTIPLAGHLSDRFGHRRTMIAATLATIVAIWPIFRLLQTGSWESALMAQALFAVIAGFLQGPLPALMAGMFPVAVRYTSIGIGYNLSVALIGGTAPAVATWLVEISGDTDAPVYYILFFALVTLLALWRVSPSPPVPRR